MKIVIFGGTGALGQFLYNNLWTWDMKSLYGSYPFENDYDT